MTNEVTASDKLALELIISMDASIGVIAIVCDETEVYRVVDELYSLALTTDSREFRLHTAETGWSTYPILDETSSNGTAFDALKPLETSPETADVNMAFNALFEAEVDPTSGTQLNGAMPVEGIFVMLDLYQNFEEPRVHSRIRKQVQRSLDNEQRLFLIVPKSATIPDEIAPLVHVIQFGYPSRSELETALHDLLEVNIGEDNKPELDDEEVAMIVSNGQGMTLNAFETAISVAITSYIAENSTMEGFGAYDISTAIREHKMQLLRKTNVLELQDNEPEENIGGLDEFKTWMHQRKATYSDTAKEHNVTPSRGALVVGPPGTGKSLVAKAAGSILNLPVIRFDVGRVFNAYVGQSEQSMRTVLNMIDAMAPCVLMLDEIDKGFAGMNGGGTSDSGTTARVFGTFLTWMQERDQRSRPVFLILTANRVEGLPPELLRKGRVDEIWAVNVPNEEERDAIIRIHMDKREQEMPNAAVTEAVSLTKNLVGAEIEACVEDALVLSLSDDNPGLTIDYFKQARESLKPMYATRAEEFKAMADWAARNARPASSLASSTVQSIAANKQRGGKIGKGRRVRAKVTRPDKKKE